MADQARARDRIAFLRGLRAVRQFQPAPVPPHVVEDLLTVARWTGSSRNRQPWELILIRRRATLQTLADLEGYVNHLAQAPLGIVVVMAGAVPEEEIYDEGRLSERIMLAGAAHGVGASIGWFSDRGSVTAKTLLDVPSERRLRTTISLGYADPAAPRRRRTQPARKPVAEFVYLEQYGRR